MNTNKLIALSDLGFKNDMTLGVIAAKILEAVDQPPVRKNKLLSEAQDMLIARDLSSSKRKPLTTKKVDTEQKNKVKRVVVRKPEKAKPASSAKPTNKDSNNQK